MIGEQTYKLAGNQIIVRGLDLLRVKGKTEPVKVYELLGTKDHRITDKKQQVLDIFNKGFENYLQQNWENAMNYFQQALKIDPMDGPSITYIRRCEAFLQNPPGKDWDGVFTMQTKG